MNALRLALRSAALISIAALAPAALSGCGGSSHRRVPSGASSAPAQAPPAIFQPAPARVAFGITEDDANLLWSPASAHAAPEPFATARRELTALHPAYVRLLIDWSKLQPNPGQPPELSAPVSGCDRELGPCGSYPGLEGELAAIASQQRAGGGFRVVIDIYGTPSWAAHEIFGCESAATPAYARPLAPSAVASYRALVRSLLALAAREGVELEWWSPWNEPNDPVFMSPQRVSCAPGSAPASVATYAQLARALDATLREAAGGTHHIVLGELGDLQAETPHTLSIARFVAALPRDVLCLAGAWSLHSYARYPPARPLPDGVSALQTALDARGGCARSAPIWVTEAGAGAPYPGRARPNSAEAEAAGCEALAHELSRWRADQRVDAVFQYSFREDPDFPVGLLSASLTHAYPAYTMWLRYASVPAGDPAPIPATACA